jgi:hypothetical protein
VVVDQGKQDSYVALVSTFRGCGAVLSTIKVFNCSTKYLQRRSIRQIVLVSSCGRAVKASDLKSDSLWERRFESCQLRLYSSPNKKESFARVLRVFTFGKIGSGGIGTHVLRDCCLKPTHWTTRPRYLEYDGGHFSDRRGAQSSVIDSFRQMNHYS